VPGKPQAEPIIADQKNLTLYHVSFMKVKKVDLRLCGKRSDFGQGFYLTTSNTQARKFVRTAVGKSGRTQRSGFVNQYLFAGLAELNILEFASADKDWLNCVCEYRRRRKAAEVELPWDVYDAMIGKIANDDTMAVINAYLGGILGSYGSDEAVRITIAALKPERLEDQVCLKSSAAVSRLQFVSSEEVLI